MRFLIMLILVLFASFSCASAQEVALKATDPPIRVEIEVNGHAMNALIDTGVTSGLVVCQRVAKEIGLVPGNPVDIHTATEKIRARRSSVRLLRIGRLSLHDVPAVILPNGVACDEPLLGRAAMRKLRLIIEGGTATVTPNGP